MMNAMNIREHMDVVGSCGNTLGTVDKVEGDRIKLTKNGPKADGQHHFIPMSWVASADQKVMLNKNCDAAVKEWQSA